MKKLRVLGEELDIKMSHSFMTKAACPFYLHCQYVAKLDDRYIRIPAERGKAAHDSIEELLGFCLKEGIPPKDLPDSQLRNAVERHSNHGILGEIGDVFRWVRLWAERFRMPAHVVGIEEKVGIDDVFDEIDFHEASYRGIIDLLQIKDTHAIVTDWKSQPNILSQTDLDLYEQGTGYCWLIQKLYPEVETFEFRLFYLRYGFYASTIRTEEDLELYEQALIIRERKISEISNWDPIPGPQCQYCDFIHRCPIALNISPEQSEVISQKQAVLAAQQVTVMETKLKELKGKLKTYVEKNDEVLIGDNWIYGFKTTETQQWNPEKLAAVLEEHDHELSELVNADIKGVKKLIKQCRKDNPSLAFALEEIMTTEIGTNFSGYKRKEG